MHSEGAANCAGHNDTGETSADDYRLLQITSTQSNTVAHGMQEKFTAVGTLPEKSSAV
jgi:hypothetical protein